MEISKDADKIKQDREQVVELGSDVTKSKLGNIYTLTIIGQVEGHQVLPENVKTTKYEHVLPLLAGIEESDDVDGLLLLLNTVGGDIEAGLAIAEMIAGMRKPTVSLVLGGGHSIGIPLAVCTKKSFITPTASMTVHPVRMTGLVVGAPQTFRYFQRIQEQGRRCREAPGRHGLAKGHGCAEQFVFCPLRSPKNIFSACAPSHHPRMASPCEYGLLCAQAPQHLHVFRRYFHS